MWSIVNYLWQSNSLFREWFQGKRQSVKYHPQCVEGYLVITSLKRKVVLCNLWDKWYIWRSKFKVLCLTGSVKSQRAVLSNGFFGMYIQDFKMYYPYNSLFKSMHKKKADRSEQKVIYSHCFHRITVYSLEGNKLFFKFYKALWG